MAAERDRYVAGSNVIELAGRRTRPRESAAGPRLRGQGSGRVPVSNAGTKVISLALPRLQALALAQFVKRVDFEMVARFAAVTVVSDDGKSEADLVWLSLVALRSALAEAAAGPPQEGDPADIPF